jgi:hypothetical protein
MVVGAEEGEGQRLDVSTLAMEICTCDRGLVARRLIPTLAVAKLGDEGKERCFGGDHKETGGRERERERRGRR